MFCASTTDKMARKLLCAKIKQKVDWKSRTFHLNDKFHSDSILYIFFTFLNSSVDVNSSGEMEFSTPLFITDEMENGTFINEKSERERERESKMHENTFQTENRSFLMTFLSCTPCIIIIQSHFYLRSNLVSSDARCSLSMHTDTLALLAVWKRFLFTFFFANVGMTGAKFFYGFHVPGSLFVSFFLLLLLNRNEKLHVLCNSQSSECMTIFWLIWWKWKMCTTIVW